ncbi:MAG TPA: sugar nucleotide-binding protein, partial [Planctomycetota bacterium]
MNANTRTGRASVLVTGAGGVLGLGLAATRPPDAIVVAGRRVPPAWPGTSFHPLELATPGAAAALVETLRPHAVLHAAALSSLGACERAPELTERVNRLAVVELAEVCARTGVFLVLVSTDQVFAGVAPVHAEGDPPCPLHAYGRSKAAAERAVLALGGAVARLPLLLGGRAGPGRLGADAALLAKLAAGERPALYRDEIRCPVGVEAASDGLWRLLAARLPGIVHLVGSEAVSRAELGRRVCAAAGVLP